MSRSARVWLPVALLVAIPALGVRAEDVKAPAEAQKADDDDVSKKSLKKDAVDHTPPALGEVGYVRRAKTELKSDAAGGGTVTATLAGGSKITVAEDKGEWVKVTGDAGAAGYCKKDDLRKKAPVEWHSNREDITYQECLGKECEGKKAKKVDKKDVLLEIDRGGPKNAFVYVKMPGDVYGWVPIAYMREWKEKFD